MPDFGRGLQLHDPAVDIAWPARPKTLFAREAACPLVSEQCDGIVQMRGVLSES